MKKLQILGTGCPKCNKLAQVTEKAAKESGVEYEIEKVTDIKKIMAFGVMATPALVIDGEVKVMGNIPDSADIMRMILS